MSSLYTKTYRIIKSRLFYLLTILLFTAQSVWIAVSARFPMAFDEAYHVGIIRLYAKQWGPLFLSQPPNSGMYSTLTRDPSYIHHYLMSFPYRLVGQFTTNEMYQIIAMRLINVALFVLGIVLFRKLLLRMGVGRAVTNAAILFFTLVPVVPLLAAHVNYDNLQQPLVALTLLMTINVAELYMRKKQVNTGLLLTLLVTAMLSSLVKFTYLPFLTAIAVYLLYVFLRYRPRKAKTLINGAQRVWEKYGTKTKVLYVSFLTVSLFLFLYTYGVNVVRYKNPIPQCGQVLSVQECQGYGPWARNYKLAQSNPGVNPVPVYFTGAWLFGMHHRLFFVINGPGNTANYQNHLAPIPALLSAVLFLGAIYVCVRYGLRIWRRYPGMQFVLFACLVYVLSVWGRNYHDYLQLGQMVAINGRYFIPVLLPLFAFTLLCYREAFAKHTNVLAWIGIVSLVCFVPGGGAISYLHYATPDWYWNNETIRNIGAWLKETTLPLFLWQ